MTLYSRRTFSKESFQWTKCVVKYLYDSYAHLSFNMLAFLVEVLEKGPSSVALPVLSIIHCMLHYVDLASPAAQPINTELLRVISKYVEVYIKSTNIFQYFHQLYNTDSLTLTVKKIMYRFACSLRLSNKQFYISGYLLERSA